MSRYVIREEERLEVVVGWDPPLQTFFVQVYIPRGRPSGDDQILVWEGTEPEAITDVERVRELVGEAAEVTDQVLQRLENDRKTSRPPSRAQRAVLQSAYTDQMRRQRSKDN